MISPRTRYDVLRRCNFACYYCGVPAGLGVAQLHIDHVAPRALGGSDHESNLVAACRDCNLGKGATVPSAELLRRVRDDYCAYLSVRNAYATQCSECGMPIENYPIEDEDDEPMTECENCNRLMYESFEAGVRHAQAGGA